MKDKRKIYLSIGISILVFSLLLASYAFFFKSSTQGSANQVSTLECLSTTIIDVTEAISLENEFPIPNAEGMRKTPYTFTVTNNCDDYNELSIGLESLVSSTLSSDYVVASLNKVGETINNGVVLTTQHTGESLSGGTNYILLSDTLKGHESKSYDLRIWIDEPTTSEQGANKSYYGKVVVTETVKIDPNPNADKSGANEPLLADNMIAVNYDEDQDVWKKADVSNPSGTNNWYNYDTQKWANAVTIISNERNTYNEAPVGTEIPMDDIVGMWVWIPRFEYRTDNLGTSYAGGTLALPGKIDVNFVNGTTINNTINYLIHPAFRNGNSEYNLPNGMIASNFSQGGWDKELTGFWYGKFETGYATNFTTDTFVISKNILIKPNVFGIKYQNISNEYLTSKNVLNDHGIGNTLDTHMSKNDEWGAVAYLSVSIYGKSGNEDFTEANKEIYMNNAYYESSFSYTTGRSNGVYSGGYGAKSSQYGTYEYNNCPATSYNKTSCSLSVRQTNATKGTGASTTGNIYGVYDMAGGLEEYVMAVVQYNNDYIYTGNNGLYNSEFTGYYSNTIHSGVDVPLQKYFNRYTSSDLLKICNNSPCYGQAFSNETGNQSVNGDNNWYGDTFKLPNTSYPWIRRGADASGASYSRMGIFYSNLDSGYQAYRYGFRVVAS